MYDDPDRRIRATLEQCRLLLIAHVRPDRFTDDHILSILHDGHPAHVLHRTSGLAE